MSHLRNGTRVSCGCANRLDLAGKRFGKLTAVQPTDHVYRSYAVWLCRCDCGQEIKTPSTFLTSGQRRSCGCNKRDDITGKRVGRLVAIEPTARRSPNRSVLWRCDCDCGGSALVATEMLKRGKTRSCGCLQRDVARRAMTTHGQSGTRAYNAWSSRRYSERKRELDCGWTLEMERALRAFQPRCALCGTARSLSVDHVQPLALGNGLYPGNAVLLCGSCNSSKGDRRPSQLPLSKGLRVLLAANAFLDHWLELEAA